MERFDLQELLQTHVCAMTGEQLVFLLSNLPLLTGKIKNTNEAEPKPKRLVHGIKGIADIFGCSIPTANRIKKSGVIDAAITQVKRKIVIDADLALKLAAEAKNKEKEEAA